MVEIIDDTSSTAQVESQYEEWRTAIYVFPGFKESTVQLLEDLRQLRTGWDGSRASPIAPEIVDAAKAMVNGLPECRVTRPHVAPLASGSLQLEWLREEKVLEIEFESPSLVHYLKWWPEESVEEEGTASPTDAAAIMRLVEWFMER